MSQDSIRAAKAAYQRKYVAQRLSNGLCTQCGRAPLFSKRKCESCLVRSRETTRVYSRASRAANVARGLTASGGTRKAPPPVVRTKEERERDAARVRRAPLSPPNSLRVVAGIAEIILPNGMIAVVDAADLPLVQGYNWRHLKSRHTFYAQANAPGASRKRTLVMHRLILGLTDRSIEADHRDGDGLNNRRDNLRIANRMQNGRNRRKAKGAVSKYKGVLGSPSGKWRSRFRNRHVGTFSSEIEAAKAYDACARREYGEFSRLNFPDN